MRARDLRVGAALCVVLTALTVLAILSTNGVPGLPSTTLRATLPAGSPAIRVGDEVRVAGRRTGLVLDVQRAAGGGQRVRLRTDAGRVGRDARLTVRLRSPAGGRYLALQRGNHQHAPLPDGGEITAANVRFTEDLPAVVDGLGHATLHNLSAATRLAGAGLDGRGGALNDALVDVDRTVSGLKSLLRAASADGALAPLVRGIGSTAGSLTGRERDDAGRALSAAATFAGVLADERSLLDETLRELPLAEDAVIDVAPRLDRTLDQVRTTSTRLAPGVRALRAALPATNRVLARGPLLRREARLLAQAAIPAWRALGPVLRAVGPAAVLLRSALPPVGELTAHLARFPREFEAGSVGYYIASLYHPPVGKAPGYPIAPAMTVVTCASGSNSGLEPGDAFTDRLDKPCR